jgi:CRP-like cAMP-binding protein
MNPYMEIHYFKKNEHICRSGEKVNYLYFFIKGKSKVYITPPNGRSFLIRFYSPVQIIGEMEILNNSNIDCNIQAVTDCICIAIPRKIIEDKCLNDYKFLHYISNHLASKLSSASLLSTVNMLYPLENRLASYILETYTNEDSNSTENLTQISEFLGSSYRHLLRVLNRFESEGIIKRNNKKLVILDKDRLEELAGDLYQ